jgi:hypothetical protein
VIFLFFGMRGYVERLRFPRLMADDDDDEGARVETDPGNDEGPGTGSEEGPGTGSEEGPGTGSEGGPGTEGKEEPKPKAGSEEGPGGGSVYHSAGVDGILSADGWGKTLGGPSMKKRAASSYAALSSADMVL